MDRIQVWLKKFSDDDQAKFLPLLEKIDRSKEHEVIFVDSRHGVSPWGLFLMIMSGVKINAAHIDLAEALVMREETKVGRSGFFPPEFRVVNGFFQGKKRNIKGIRFVENKDPLNAILCALLLDINLTDIGISKEEVSKILANNFRRKDLLSRAKIAGFSLEIPCDEEINSFIREGFEDKVVNLDHKSEDERKTIIVCSDGTAFSFFFLEIGKGMSLFFWELKEMVRSISSGKKFDIKNIIFDGEIVIFKEKGEVLYSSPFHVVKNLFEHVLMQKTCDILFNM